MAFQVINASEIEVGDPVTAALLAKVKASLDDLNSRQTATEGQDRRVVVFDHMVYNAAVFPSLNGLMHFRASFPFTLTEAKIVIFDTSGLSDVLEVDVKKAPSLDPVGFATVFDTRPSIDYATASDYEESNNMVLNNIAKDIDTGDYLRLDITETPSGGIVPIFMIILYGEV